jgi:hypothetical protein
MLDVFQLVAARIDEELETILFHKERCMIRFIDMGNQVYEDGNQNSSFAFLDTMTDNFLEFDGAVYWDTYEEFVIDFQASLAKGGTARRANFWIRLNGLIPASKKPKQIEQPHDYKTSEAYISGQPLSFSIQLKNGFAVTINSLVDTPLVYATEFEVKVARVNYRYLKLDAKLPDSQDIVLNPEELIICLNAVLSFSSNEDLPLAEKKLRQLLNKTL